MSINTEMKVIQGSALQPVKEGTSNSGLGEVKNLGDLIKEAIDNNKDEIKKTLLSNTRKALGMLLVVAAAVAFAASIVFMCIGGEVGVVGHVSMLFVSACSSFGSVIALDDPVKQSHKWTLEEQNRRFNKMLESKHIKLLLDKPYKRDFHNAEFLQELERFEREQKEQGEWILPLEYSK